MPWEGLDETKAIFIHCSPELPGRRACRSLCDPHSLESLGRGLLDLKLITGNKEGLDTVSFSKSLDVLLKIYKA